MSRRALAAQQGGIKQLGPYKILKKLGEGGMGAVYLAQDTGANRQVALKVLPKKHSSDQSFLSRFRREARATGSLNHANIVAAYTTGEDMGVHYFAMEFCDGEPLDAKVKRETMLAWDVAVNITTQVARGLKHAHDSGLIHRDIKPANILLTKDGVAKILDLGLSKNIGDAELSFNTQTGVALGTPHYISPEQARGDKVIDGRTDIYSLGATLYQLLTGQTPFQGSTAAMIMMKHITGTLPNPQDLNPDVPDGVVLVIQRMMAKEPSDRYRDCDALLRDLELVSAGKSPGTHNLDEGKSSIAMRKVAAPRKVARGASPASRVASTATRGAAPAASRKSAQAAKPPPGSEAATSELPAQRKAGNSNLLIGAGAAAAALLLVVVLAFSGKKKTQVPGVEDLPQAPVAVVKPDETLKPVAKVADTNGPADDAWVTRVQGLKPEEQIAAVAKKLEELNPGFDGKVGGYNSEHPHIENGVVTTFSIRSKSLKDISPVRVLKGLQRLSCTGNYAWCKFSDLEPLRGLKLIELDCRQSAVSNLAPLKGMPLELLYVNETAASDLSPLHDLPLKILSCNNSGNVSDVTPLKGMALDTLSLNGTKIKDFSALKGMPLHALTFCETPVSDLSPLQGMPLTYLDCSSSSVKSFAPLNGMKLSGIIFDGVNVSDITPLADMPLREVHCTYDPKRDEAVLRSIKTLEKINGISKVEFLAKKGAPPSIVDDVWIKSVQGLKPEEQIAAVIEKLKDLNPGFDGKETHTIVNNTVTGFKLSTNSVADISPVRGFPGLTHLTVNGSDLQNSKLSNLSPLKGLKLTYLDVSCSPALSDLTPLRGMPLEFFSCIITSVRDLSPLHGAPIRTLLCGGAPITDLSAVEGMPLTVLDCFQTKVTDLSPLTGLKLTSLVFLPKNITRGMDVIRQMNSLKEIHPSWDKIHELKTDAFWKRYDAGEFGTPLVEKAPALPPPDADGFVSLFNGRDLTGWEGDPGVWSVKDGAIEVDVSKAAGGDFRDFWLVRRGMIVDDFEIRLLCRNESRSAGAGIGYRARELPGLLMDGYQIDYCLGAGELLGHIWEGARRKALSKACKKVIAQSVNGQNQLQVVGETDCSPSEITKSLRANGWDELTVIAQGNHLVHKINGLTVADCTDQNEAQRSLSGLLALKIFRDQSTPRAQFKDIRYKKLRAAPPVAVQTIDLLALTDPVKDRASAAGSGKNDWKKNGSVLVYTTDGKSGKIMAPVSLSGARDYEIEADVRSQSGGEALTLDIPVSTSRQTVLDIYPQGSIGLKSKDGVRKPIGEWPKTLGFPARLLAHVHFDADPAQSSVTLSVNGERIAQWKGIITEMGGAPKYHPDFPGQMTPSLYCYHDSFEFTAWTLRVFDGEAKMLRPVEEENLDDPARWAKAINLLALVDPQQDIAQGKWSVQNGELTGTGNDYSHQSFPYRPPEEYDFRIRFTRTENGGYGSVIQHLALNGHEVLWNMGGFGNTVSGFEKVGGKAGNENSSTVQSGLTTGRKTEAIVQVRRGRIQAFMDGKRVSELATDGSNLSLYEKWVLRDANLLGVGCQQTTVFHSAEVLEISGKGTFTRTKNAAIEAEKKPEPKTQTGPLNAAWRADKPLDQWEVVNAKPGATVTKERDGGVLLHGSQWLQAPGECANVLIQARVKWISGNSLWVGLRQNSEGSYGADLRAASVVVEALDSASVSQGHLGFFNAPNADDDFHTLTFVAFGDRLRLYVDDQLRVDIVDNRRTKAGVVRYGADGDAIFRDVRVMEAPAGVASVEEFAQLALKSPASLVMDTPAQWAKAVDLMPFIDLTKDISRGNWRQKGSSFETDASAQNKLEPPYKPPAEYDVRIEFTPMSGVGNVNLGLTHLGKAFSFSICGNKPSCDISGIETVAGKTAVESGTGKQGKVALMDRHSALARVRNDSVAVFLDDVFVQELKTDFHDLGNVAAWTPRDPKLLVIGTNLTAVQIHKIQVREVTGKSEFTRKNDPIVVESARWAKSIDLLKLVDPGRDKIQDGGWQLVNDELIGGWNNSRLALPYRPPDEYDLRVRFTFSENRGGNGPIKLHFARSGRAVSWTMGVFNDAGCGFETVNGKDKTKNPSAAKLNLEPEHLAELVFKIRRNGLQVFSDGKLLSTLITDGSNLTVPAEWALPDSTVLALLCNRATVFHSIEVLEITGKGVFTRAGEPPAIEAEKKRTAK